MFGSLITREWRWQRQWLMDLALTWQLPFAWLPSCDPAPLSPSCSTPKTIPSSLPALISAFWQNVQLLPLPAHLNECFWAVLAGGVGRERGGESQWRVNHSPWQIAKAVRGDFNAESIVNNIYGMLRRDAIACLSASHLP